MLSKQKIVTSGLLLSFVMAMLYAAHAPRNVLFVEPGTMDIMTYPKVLLYALSVAVLVYVVLPAHDERSCNWKEVFACWPTLLGTACAYGVYAFLFEYCGLAVSTFLFMLCFFWVMKYRQWRYALPIALIGAIVTWLVFEKILAVPMPTPFWISSM